MTIAPEVLAQNQQAWDQLAIRASPFAHPATDAECMEPLKSLDGRGWLPATVRGLDVLCLAAGGGWQSILYAAAGARVTVFDLSGEMLRLDAREALRRNYSVRTMQGSMDNLSELADDSFDIVHQPVSTCYVPKIAPVYREIARVLRGGGLYISQHKQPTTLQITHRDHRDRYVMGLEYYAEGSLPNVTDESYRETGTAEYLHRWEELVGGLCEAGFVIEDLREPYRANYEVPAGHFGHRGRFTPPYLRMKARRLAKTAPVASSNIWIPT